MGVSPFSIIPFDAYDTAATGQLRWLMVQQGTPNGSYDIQIAAQAFARDMTVVTHNISEFSRIPGLKGWGLGSIVVDSKKRPPVCVLTGGLRPD